MKAMPHLWFQWAIATPGLGPALLSKGRQRLARWLFRGFETRPMNDADVAAYVETLRDPAHARAASKLYRGLILPGFMNVVRGSYLGRVLHTPTLVLFGADDELMPQDALMVSPADAPHTTVEFVPGGAPLPCGRQPGRGREPDRGLPPALTRRCHAGGDGANGREAAALRHEEPPGRGRRRMLRSLR